MIGGRLFRNLEMDFRSSIVFCICLARLALVAATNVSSTIAVAPGSCDVPAYNITAASAHVAFLVTRVDSGGHCSNGNLLCALVDVSNATDLHPHTPTHLTRPSVRELSFHSPHLDYLEWNFCGNAV